MCFKLLKTNLDQERSKGTSSVAFEVLIISWQKYFINLFIFNCLTVNIIFFIFNLFDVKFLFSENHIFYKQKRTAVYGLQSLVSVIKITREKDDLLSSRHTKMRLPNKRYQTNAVRTFWGTSNASDLRYLGLDHFGTTQKLAKYKRDYGIRNFRVLDKLMRLCICSQHRVFALPWWYVPIQTEKFRSRRSLYCTMSRCDNF